MLLAVCATFGRAGTRRCGSQRDPASDAPHPGANLRLFPRLCHGLHVPECLGVWLRPQFAGWRLLTRPLEAPELSPSRGAPVVPGWRLAGNAAVQDQPGRGLRPHRPRFRPGAEKLLREGLDPSGIEPIPGIERGGGGAQEPRPHGNCCRVVALAGPLGTAAGGVGSSPAARLFAGGLLGGHGGIEGGARVGGIRIDSDRFR